MVVKPRASRKSVVIIDDHTFLRQGLERVLNSTEEFFVCEEAANAADGLEAVREMRPDAVIVDIGLPDTDGIELTKQLVAKYPGIIVLVLSMHEEAEYAVRAMQAGARGYIMKNEAVDTLPNALREVFSGKRLFSTTILDGTV